MLNDIKKYLRINHNEFDGEIQDLIDACIKEFKISGIASSIIFGGNDPLVKRAISIYCKAHFGYDNPDRENLIESYNLLKMHLTLSTEYKGEYDVA